MCNSIFIDKDTLPKAKDGQEYEITIKGVYHTEDGVRKFDVKEADGNPVVGAEKEESDCGCGESHEDMPDAHDALRLFIIKTRKK